MTGELSEWVSLLVGFFGGGLATGIVVALIRKVTP